MPVKRVSQGRPQWNYCVDLVTPSFVSIARSGTVPSPLFHGLVVPALKFYRLNQVTIHAVTSKTAQGNTFFGETELTNGVLIEALDDNDVVQETFGTDVIPITIHNNFGSLAGSSMHTYILVPGDEDNVPANLCSAVNITWDLTAAGEPFLLAPEWTFRFVIQDDLSGIDLLNVMVHGALSPA